MTQPLDPARDLNQSDLEGFARRIANNAIQSAEIDQPGLVGLGHHWHPHIVSAALEILQSVTLHERQRGERPTTGILGDQ